MSKTADQVDNNRPTTATRTTIVTLAKRSDGTWEATQGGLDIVGIGDSAARATEDMARTIAERQESEEL